MQRWIVAGVVFVVVSIMLLIGAYYGHRFWQQNKITGIWLPLPVEQASVEQRAQLAEDFKQRLGVPEVMTSVAKDSGFTKDFGFASDAEAAKDLLGRFFSRQGHFKAPDGRTIPVVEVGFTCKVKDFHRMQKVTAQLSKEIQSLTESPEPQSDSGPDGAF